MCRGIRVSLLTDLEVCRPAGDRLEYRQPEEMASCLIHNHLAR